MSVQHVSVSPRLTSTDRVPDLGVHRAAVLCLAQALVKSPVPKRAASLSDCGYVGLADGGAGPTLKETLMAWLLMRDQSEEMEESSKPHPIICR